MFAAQFKGRCASCGNEFPAGRLVKYNEENKLVEVACANATFFTEEAAAEARKNMCPGCFLVLPKSGVCTNCE